MCFEPEQVRGDFPALAEYVHGKPLVYLDNAATAQMPRAVMDAIEHLELRRGNVHRGIHTLSDACTEAYENARRVCGTFLGAVPEQITFTAGTTDSINRVAAWFSENRTGGVVVSVLEHHSNFVPWQQVCLREGRPFRVVPITAVGQLDLHELERCLDDTVELLAITQCSNVLGTVTPIQEICRMAHDRGILVLVDGAQSVCHMPVNVEELGCDFFVCSGHKLGGPFGIGLLYCREPMEPVLWGGGMVDRVTVEETTFAQSPQSGEAGTPNVSGAVGLAAAIEYRMQLPQGWQAHEERLLELAEQRLEELEGVHVLGTGDRMGCLSFTIDGVQPFDAAVLLDQLGIALRSGHHCAQPLLQALEVPYTLRISPAFYNTEEEIDALVAGMKKILPLLRG